MTFSTQKVKPHCVPLVRHKSGVATLKLCWLYTRVYICAAASNMFDASMFYNYELYWSIVVHLKIVAAADIDLQGILVAPYEAALK